MLEVLDGVINQNRFDVDVAAGVIASGIQGLWVSPTAGGYDFAAEAAVAYVIWTESSKDGSVGFTEDANYLNKVAVLSGSFRALTDKYDSTPALNDLLKTTATGTLATASSGDNAVAICTKAPHTITYLGASKTVIEFQTFVGKTVAS